MFEARLLQGSQLKKIIEAIRELVVDANLDCSDEGITMQVRYLNIPKSPALVDNF
jgi:proliferating cell nuclear antigen